jgi:DNA modification methylase
MAFALADNKTSELAEWDDDILKYQLDWLDKQDFDIGDIGFMDYDLPGESKGTDGLTDPDEVPEVPQNVFGVKRGDVWLLGNHRLMCGDSTSEDDVKNLMDGQKADITFTSPPYNVGRTPNGNEQKYLNDKDNKNIQDYIIFLKSFTELSLNFSDYVFVNIQSLAGNKIALIEFLYLLKENYADTIIWDKMTAEPAIEKNVLNSRFEYIHIFSKKANRKIGAKEFRGTIPNMFQMNSRQEKEYAAVHKATFPTSFAEFFINNFSNINVYEPFCGTGTTIIASEKTGRTCYGMELDEHYCSVIIKRWQDFTGKTAIKEV